MGDLNTMAHGVARLNPFFCWGSMRWRSIGSTEAQVSICVISSHEFILQWWYDNVLSFSVDDGEKNKHLEKYNYFSDDVLKGARNIDLFDPFDAVNDFTVQNTMYVSSECC
jgi:hypothetical protein